MYGHEPPRSLKIDELLRSEKCPASAGRRSLFAKPQLDRWIAIRDATAEWHAADDPDEDLAADIVERQLGWMDPVQRPICEEAFLTYRRLFRKIPDEQVDLDPEWSTVYDDGTNASISVPVQLGITSGEGTEFFKLKTGRARSKPEEVAVLLEDGDPDATYHEARLMDGEFLPLEMAAEDRSRVIRRLFAIPAAVELNRGVRNPGVHCYTCPCAARCGQYPVVGDRVPGGNTRTVVLSKKWLAHIDECQRRVAWARLYYIPDPTLRDDADVDLPRTSVGLAFHEATAAALTADDPEAVFRDAASSVAESDRQELLMLWDRHKQLVAAEPAPVDVAKTEFGLGATFVVPGIDVDRFDNIVEDAPVAVVTMGIADAVGREPDGTPAVIEHRTGVHASAAKYEPEIYALGTALLTGATSVAVHIHRLRNPSVDERCERIVFEREDLDRAATELHQAALKAASWHPQNALSPAFEVDDWCGRCPYEGICRLHRAVAPGAQEAAR